jgi:hypothetical protein
LLVIVLAGALQSLNAQVSRDSPSNEVGQGRSQSEQVEEDQEDRSTSETENTVDLGDTGLSLDPVQDGVSRKLMVGRVSVQPGYSKLQNDTLTCLSNLVVYCWAMAVPC